MLVIQFIGLNAFFGVNLLAALVCFGVFWLIFDAWTIRRSRVELIKWVGFLALSIGFLLRAAAVNAQTSDLLQLFDLVADGLRLAGYGLIALGQVLDPIMPRPTLSDEPSYQPSTPELAPIIADKAGEKTVPDATKAKSKRTAKAKTSRTQHYGLLPFSIPSLALPLVAALGGLLYLRRATTGLERHLLPVAWSFAGLTVFELLGNAKVFQNTTNPILYQLVDRFGPIWWAAIVVLAVAMLTLGAWVWRYLTKRLQSELFITIVALTLGVFLFTTIGVTLLSLRSSQAQTLADLSTASNVLQYAVTSRQAETAAQAEALASMSSVVSATAARDTPALSTALNGYLPRHNLTSLLVLDGSGQVLYRGEDPKRWGDSRSSDAHVRRALIGDAAVSVVVSNTAATPTVTLVAANPIRNANGNVIGATVTGRVISGAFVDGIRQSTGLDSAVYGGKIRAATTLTEQGGTNRAIGITETDAGVISQVLTKGKTFTGAVNFQNRPYLAAYTPLRDVNNGIVGMLLVAQPASALFTAAYQSIQLIFFLVAALIVLAVYPVFLISRYLSRQIR